MRKPILCLDFDGVLHSYGSGWKGPRCIPDPPVPGAMRFLADAVEEFEVHVFSSRGRYVGGRRAMKRWLELHLTAELGASLAVLVHEQLRFPLFKPAALVAIDDRALTFTGTWPGIADLRRFKPWNRRGR